MSKLEKFITKNFNLNEEDQKNIPRIVARCQQEIDDSENGELSEYSLYDIVDDEMVQIQQEQENQSA